MPISKTELVKEYLAKEEYEKALRIGKTFRKGDKQLIADIQRGWDAIKNQEFYKQLKLDPNQLYNKGIESLKKLINKEVY